MTNEQTILITGVTGQQGGAVAQALQGFRFHLRGLTRKSESERAAALTGQGIEIGLVSVPSASRWQTGRAKRAIFANNSF
jgi:uncharacterized protein YbjT (DUF2867 family)